MNQQCAKKTINMGMFYASKKTILRFHGKFLCRINNWWVTNLSIGIAWTNTLLSIFSFVLRELKKCQKNFEVKYYLNKAPNFLRDEESNIWRDDQLEKIYHGKNIWQILRSNVPNLSRVLSAGEPGILLSEW